jgi:hypothetical protein
MINNVSHVPARLIYAKKGQDIEYTWMHFPTTVCNDAYNHLEPRLARQVEVYTETHLLPRLNSPCMRVFTTTQMRDITHDAV